MSDLALYGRAGFPTDPNDLRPAVLQSLILAKAILKSVPVESLDQKGYIKAEVLNLWCAVLAGKGVTEEEVKQASVEHMASCTFFPTPHDYMQIITRLRAKAKEEHEQFLREQRRRLEAAEEKRQREEWESLPQEERDQILANSQAFRRRRWDELQASMAEFDREHPERRVPGFMNMSDGIADLKDGEL